MESLSWPLCVAENGWIKVSIIRGTTGAKLAFIEGSSIQAASKIRWFFAHRSHR